MFWTEISKKRKTKQKLKNINLAKQIFLLMYKVKSPSVHTKLY